MRNIHKTGSFVIIFALLATIGGARAQNSIVYWEVDNLYTGNISVVKAPSGAGLLSLPTLSPTSVGSGGMMTTQTAVTASNASGFVYVGFYAGSPYNKNVYCSFSMTTGILNPDGTIPAAPSIMANTIVGEGTNLPHCVYVSSVPYPSGSNNYKITFQFKWNQ